jgi:hypothetical protein
MTIKHQLNKVERLAKKVDAVTVPMQTKLILLPPDCCAEEVERLTAMAQKEFPLYSISALNPVSNNGNGGKRHPHGRVLDPGETYTHVMFGDNTDIFLGDFLVAKE